jgi:hypothetical protein
VVASAGSRSAVTALWSNVSWICVIFRVVTRVGVCNVCRI